MRKFLLFGISLFCSFSLVAQLTVDFSADVTEGCAPLTVSFTDNSASNGTITSWDWSFGDGMSSDWQNPEVTYLQAASVFEVCLTVTDDLAQSDTHCKTAFITTFEEPIADAGPDQLITCFMPEAVLTGAGSTTGPGIQYEWLDMNNNVISFDILLTVTASGTYTLIVTNEDNCFASSAVEVLADVDVPIASIGASSLCSYPFTLGTGSSSAGPNISYEWQDGQGSTIGTDIEVQVSEAGNYVLIVNDDNNGCFSTDTIAVEDPEPLLIEEETPVQQVSCYGENDGAIDIIVSGGYPPYEYLWSNGETTEDLFNLAPGIYIVTVTDANECTHAVAKTVVEPPQLILSVAITDQLLCADDCNGVILAVANGGCGNYTYNWNNGVSESAIAGLCSDLYSVTVTDCNGCTESIEVFLPEAPEPLELSYTTTCATASNDGSIDLSVMGGVAPYTYSWLPGTMTQQDIIDLAPGNYSVTVTDANGCTITETIALSNIIQGITNDTTVCEGDEMQLFVDAPSAVSYEWTPSDYLSCSDCPDPVYTGNTSIVTYLVTVEDANGCIEQELIVFSVWSYLDFNLLTFSNSPVFEGSSVELYCNVLNPMAVDWTGPDNFASSECDPGFPNATGANEGDYTVMIEDEFGCEASAIAHVEVLTIIDSIGADGAICLGETYQLFVEAPDAVSIQWSPAVTLDDPNSATPIASPTESTTYTVTVEDALGNVDIATVFVAVDEVPVLAVTGPVSVCSGEDIMICVEGGGFGLYLWTGPNGFTATTSCFELIDVDPTMSGCYQIEYTTPSGCVAIDEICIDVSDFEIQSITNDTLICSGDVVELEVTPSGVSFFYEWFPEIGLDCPTCPLVMASPEETTTYVVTVINADGCQDEALVVVGVDQDCVWPGDTDTSKVVDNFDLLNIGLAYDSVGPVRPSATLGWNGQMAPDWLQTHPGIEPNFKHIDANGDGTINADDTLAITLNWGETHNFKEEDPDEFFLPVVEAPFYVEPDTLIEGESHSLAVILGDMDNPVDEIYGLAFSLEYDSTVIVPGSAYMAFDDGWIGTKGTDMIAVQKTFVSPGRVDIGMTRIDGENMSGFGEIGRFNITIEDDILFRPEDDDSRGGDELDVKFNITNIRLINFAGAEIPVEATETASVIDESVSVAGVDWENYIEVKPNPAKDAFFIAIKNIEVTNIGLFQLTGEQLWLQVPESTLIEVDTENLVQGIYLLKIQTEKGLMVEKVVVLK